MNLGGHNMDFPRRRTRITYEGMSFLAILSLIVIGSIMRQINLLVLLSGLMMGPLLFNWRMARKSLERLRIRHVLPDWVHARTPFSMGWRVDNRKSDCPAWGIRIVDTIRDPRDPQTPVMHFGTVISRIETQGHATADVRCQVSRRGVYELGPTQASSAFPVGLVRSWITVPTTESVVVAPEQVAVSRVWIRSVLGSERSHHQPSTRRFGNSQDDFFALREWQTGDSRRLIHWRSSARRGEILVRQGVDTHSQRTHVWIDFGTPGPREDDDQLASLAAAVMRSTGELATDRNRFTFSLFGDEAPLLDIPLSTGALVTLMTRLATIRSSSENGIDSALRSHAMRHEGQARVVVLSNRERDDALSDDVAASHWNAAFEWINVTHHWAEIVSNENVPGGETANPISAPSPKPVSDNAGASV